MGVRTHKWAAVWVALGIAALILGSLIVLGRHADGGVGVHAAGRAGRARMAAPLLVSITTDGFDPSVVTVALGTTVTWMNELTETVHLVSGYPYYTHLPLVLRGADSSGNTLPSGAALSPHAIWGDVDIAPGETYAHTFVEPGVHVYYLATRPQVSGQVIVATDDAPPVAEMTNLNYPDFSVPHYGSTITGPVPEKFTLQFDDASYDLRTGIHDAVFQVQGYAPLIGSQGSHFTFPVGFVGAKPFTYTVTDGAGLQGVLTGTLVGTNDTPTEPGVSVTPVDPTTADDLICLVTTLSTDPNGDLVSYAFGWQTGLAAQRTLGGPTSVLSVTIDASNTRKGDTWQCRVTSYDGIGYGGTASAQVTVRNSPPTAPYVDVTPDHARSDENLTCRIATPSTDADGDDITYQYRWYENGVPASGATHPTLSAARTSKGDTWRCVVTPHDGTDAGATASDQTTIVNSPPSAPVVNLTPDQPGTADDLTCGFSVPSTDADGDPITYQYEWFKDGDPVSVPTGATLPSSRTTKGETWSCRVTPHDGTEAGNSDSDQVTVLNSPPTTPAIDLTPDVPATDDDLTCGLVTPSTDADGDPITYRYAWYVDDVLVSSETEPTLASSLTTKGDTWRCVVTSYDGTDAGEPVSDQVTVINSLPTTPVINVTPDLPTADENLNCQIETQSTDVDGDTITYLYRWYVNDVLVEGADQSTLSATHTTKNETWRCEVTPHDGTAAGPSDSDQVTVLNSAPTAPVVDVTPDLARTDDDLTCEITVPSTDVDGDPIAYQYQWYVNGVPASGATHPTLSAARTSREDTWRCEVTPHDGAAAGPSDSDAVTIANSAPTQPEVSITPGSPYTSDDLVCTITTPSTDADGDVITYVYQWYENDVLVEGETNATLASSLTTKGDTWRCVAAPFDGTDYGPSTSDQVTVINSPPTAPTIDLTPDLPGTNDDLICGITAASTDADEDAIAYLFQWHRDDEPVVDETIWLLPSSRTSPGEVWRCTVTPYDGEVFGSSDSDQVTIQ